MNIKVILFDLDGTLLPMELKRFQRTSGRLFAEKMAEFGYDPDVMDQVSQKAIMAMSANDGRQTNSEVYFSKILDYYGEGIKKDFFRFYDFYDNEFEKVKEVCGYNPEAEPTVRKLKSQGFRLVLATNPWFPENAIKARLRWAGVNPECFEYMTLIDNSHYCKPKIEYYEEILEKINVEAEACLMVGNDVQEDMVAAETGMKVFLMTDNLINRSDADISNLPQGSFKDLLAFLKCI